MLRALKDETQKLQERLAHAHSELIKEKGMPKPSQWSKEQMDFRDAMESASQSAASLASALARIDSKHEQVFLQVSRICGESGGDDAVEMLDAIEILGDVLLFRRFRSGLDAATGRIIRVQEMLEPTRPRLQLLKNQNHQTKAEKRS